MNLRCLGRAIVFATLCLVTGPALAQTKTFNLGVPGGPPPIFASVIAVVADKQSFFKQQGVDVTVKYPESGTAAARALISGDLDAALAPTALTINQVSNTGADVVGLYGMPKPSHLLASTDFNATCKDVRGQPVGVDTVGGARSNSLKEILESCGLTIQDVQQIPLPSTSTMAAMIAGRLTFGVLHFDEVPVIEQQGKPVKIVATLVDVNPTGHFAMVTVRRSELGQHRDAYVRIVAALVQAARFMKDPANLDRAAEIATITSRTPEQAKAAFKTLNDIGYWPTDDDGLDPQKLNAVIAHQVESKAIRPGKQPVAYDQLVDRSVWRDAVARLGKP